MKLFKLLLLIPAAVLFTFITAAQNVAINVQTQNSGLVNLNGTVFVQMTISNTSSTTTLATYKIRPSLSVPVSIVSIPATGHTLPPGWTILSNIGGVIRVSNGTDQIPPLTSRTVLIALHGDVIGGPLTVQGQMAFSTGAAPGSASGAPTAGNSTADDNSTSTVQVVQGSGCIMTLNTSVTNVSCFGTSTGAVDLTVNGANGAVTIAWTGPGGFTSNQEDITGLPAGTYNVTVTENGNPACTASTSVTVDPGEPVLAPEIGTITQPTCSVSTGTVQLNGLPNGGSWTLIRTPGSITIPGTGTTTTINGLATGTYTFTVTNSEGCTSVASAPVVIDQIPTAPAAPTVISPVNYCQGAAAIALTATGTNLLWYTTPSSGTGNSTAPIPSTASAGTTSYYVSQTVSGCESPRAQINVVVTNSITPTFTQIGPLCQNATAPYLPTSSTKNHEIT